MKTTVEIPDALFRDAKAYAARNGLPLRSVIELGLQIVVKGAARPKGRFRLKTVTTKGAGLAGDGDWNAIRAAIYEGHGG
ncbi:MAG: hypothetical protein ABIZ80_18455 [Bryobacteraceae bacterium]